MSDVFRADFLGVFAVVRRGPSVLFVGNDRTIDGRTVRTWDLPGGRVEAGELLPEALRRELREETGLELIGEPRFLFVQEGERVTAAGRLHAWRSFFFAAEVGPGEPQAGHEVLAVRWLDEAAIEREVVAPYHDSFRQWLRRGGSYFSSVWRDPGC
ncbi:MAG: NUDIX domain-containing protein [Planctomycetes bacterium]|jgi:8-oxo-dGTP diphosphatase|nr:NUDIX domain-containing protein [Planctomycetota bacterium]